MIFPDEVNYEGNQKKAGDEMTSTSNAKKDGSSKGKKTVARK